MDNLRFKAILWYIVYLTQIRKQKIDSPRRFDAYAKWAEKNFDFYE